MSRVLAVLLVLVLAGCGGSEPGPPVEQPPPTATLAPVPAPPPTAGPADQPGDFGDGVTVSLVKVERMPRDLGFEVPADETIVRVTFAIRAGKVPQPLDPADRSTTVLYGEDLFEAEAEPGYGGVPRAQRLQVDGPRRVSPGSTVTLFESSRVPSDQLRVLAVEVRLQDRADGYRTWTFTGVEGLLK